MDITGGFIRAAGETRYEVFDIFSCNVLEERVGVEENLSWSEEVVIIHRRMPAEAPGLDIKVEALDCEEGSKCRHP